MILRLPLVGTVARHLILSRFAKVLGLLLMSGVPVIKAMEITGEAVVNRAYRSFLQRVKEDLIQGGSLSAGLRNSPLFPPLLAHMIAVGEKSGELEQMLIKAGAPSKRSSTPPSAVHGAPGTASRAGHGAVRRTRGGGGAAADIPAEPAGEINRSRFDVANNSAQRD